MDWLDLKDKVIVVTGAASGIGKAIAEELLKVGAKVSVFDLVDKADIKNTNENNYIYIKTNITDREEVKKAVEKTADHFGRIDGLVNNAGINKPALLLDKNSPRSKYEISDKLFDLVVDVNLKGLYIVSQEVGYELLKNEKAVIINMSSASGLEGSEGQSVYAATKSAVTSFTRSWAKELGKYNIRVLGVAPDIVEETGLRTLEYEKALAYTRSITIEELRKGYTSTKTTPLGRSAKLSEIADFVTYLLSDRASYIHGVTINIAGGKSRG
ncbi:MAG: SDR family oxidoreductase [Tissierellia bacterium]|nr:SDR family oxidoreductase [Tissierellia bacterium]